MIKGLHAMYYSSEPDALRSFFKDIFNLPATDVGQGWLIFDIPKCELGIHPSTGPQIEKEVASGTADITGGRSPARYPAATATPNTQEATPSLGLGSVTTP